MGDKWNTCHLRLSFSYKKKTPQVLVTREKNYSCHLRFSFSYQIILLKDNAHLEFIKKQILILLAQLWKWHFSMDDLSSILGHRYTSLTSLRQQIKHLSTSNWHFTCHRTFEFLLRKKKWYLEFKLFVKKHPIGWTFMRYELRVHHWDWIFNFSTLIVILVFDIILFFGIWYVFFSFWSSLVGLKLMYSILFQIVYNVCA